MDRPLRVLLTIAAPALAVALVLPLAYLPHNDASMVLGFFWGAALGVGVLAAWGAAWSKA